SSTSSPLLYLALLSFFSFFCAPRELHSFPTRRSSDLTAESPMITALLFITFAVLMLIGTSVGVALGVAGTLSIVLTNLDTNWYGLLAVPQNFYAGLAKYPLLAIPMFVLVGSIFRSEERRVGRECESGG